jgi:hypothetical protein
MAAEDHAFAVGLESTKPRVFFLKKIWGVFLFVCACVCVCFLAVDVK